MLTALSSYRTQQRPAAHQANIAWLYSNPEASSRGSGDFGEYFKGAEERARQLGYILDEINIRGEYEDPKRLRRLLDARAISPAWSCPRARWKLRFRTSSIST